MLRITAQGTDSYKKKAAFLRQLLCFDISKLDFRTGRFQPFAFVVIGKILKVVDEALC
jgi:hypothetical protein